MPSFLHADITAVQFDQLLDDRKPQPAVPARGGGVCLAESIKHERQEFRLDPFARVRHRHFKMRVNALENDLDLHLPPLGVNFTAFDRRFQNP